MNKVESNIGALQDELNELVRQVDLYTEDMPEIYTLSKQLDDLIVAYYKDNTAMQDRF